LNLAVSTECKSENATHVVRSDSFSKRYGDVVAVEDLTFAVEAGTIAGFLGPNGADKSMSWRRSR